MEPLTIIGAFLLGGWLLCREKKEDRLVREAREAEQRETARMQQEADAKIQAAEQTRKAAEAEAEKQAAEMRARKEAMKEEALAIRRSLTSNKAKHELDEQMRAAGIELVKRHHDPVRRSHRSRRNGLRYFR
jgi:hypothetical protein